MKVLQTLKILKYILVVWIVIHGIRALIVVSMFMLGLPSVELFGGSLIALVTGVIIYRVIDGELKKHNNLER